MEVERYHPLHWYHLARMNNRTHRKLLVVDGQDRIHGRRRDRGCVVGQRRRIREHWRDSHYRVEGPAVAQMQAAFMDNWTKTTGRVLQGERYFPALQHVGRHAGTGVHAARRSGGARQHVADVPDVDRRQREARIDLSAAYFVPDELTLQVLLDALKRGVRLRIIVPGQAHRLEGRAQGVAEQLGSAAGGRGADP